MEITSCLKELLTKYECVIIPDFGALLTRYTPSYIDADSSLFSPPKKEISFNSLLFKNDGILTNFFAKKYNLNYENALKNLNEQIGIIKERIKSVPIIIDGVGEFSTDKEGKIIFNPYNNFNFELNSFGLEPFKIDILKTVNSTNNSKFVNMENKKTEPLSFEPGKVSYKFSPMKYVAVFLVVLSIGILSFYLINDYINEKRIASTKAAQEKIKNNVQKATFNLGSLNTIPIEISLKEKKFISSNPFYSVIAGSFRNEQNAKKLLNVLLNQGYNAEIISSTTNDLFRVAYGKFSSKNKALNLFYFIRYTLEEDAWYLEN
tara:strand:+ start:19431 stop:20387 length:957 start_codon:yes stop_codon:yes gene_type:complete